MSLASAQIVGGAGLPEELVEVVEVADLGDGGEVVPTEAPDRALDAALFVGPFFSRSAEDGLEQVVRAHGDKEVGLQPAHDRAAPS